MSDGQITFNTALDNSQLEKDLKDAEKKVDDLQKKLDKNEHEKGVLAEQMKQAQAEIEKTEQKIVSLGNRLKELEELSATDPAGAAARAEVVTEEFIEQAKIYDQQVKASDQLADKMNKLDIEAGQYTKELASARDRQAELGREYARSYSQGSTAFTGAMASMEKRFNAFTSKITKRVKKLFVFSFIFGALSSLKSYITSTVGENDRLAASIENLKAIMKGFAAPAINMLAQVLTSIVNVISTMLMTLARLVDNIFHTNIVQSIQQAQQAARSASNAADATDEQADATDRLAKAQKKAAKWLAAFDELNMMQADNDEDISDAMNDLAGGDGAANPDWNALDVGKIDEKLSAIMIILGAALLAVGAVLAFSGINIPLGLTLMAIGALMIYSAVSENWDKLPKEVRDAINAALIITGIVLIVIGAVLAFSGANIPLGIGLMIAGALLLYTAAAINWDSLPAEVRAVITVISVILGAALLVVGAVLALSGANVPLGVGLMAAGAVTLAAIAAINWDSMTDEVKGVVVTIMAILGAALIVVGAIIALSGANIPLGVGLIAAGVVALAAAAYISWDQLPEDIRRTVGIIMGILGAALLVVGVILVFTGVATPLGIALMAAGAASLAAAAAINWDWITDNVGTVLDTLKRVLAPIGAIAIVLGIVLVFTGVATPLGIALIAAGAAALIASAALNWEWLTKNVGTVLDTLKKWLAPIGIIAIVLGVILLFTGVATPLGIALIAAGAAALIASVALNWDAITTTISNVVEGLKKYLFPAGIVAIILGVILCVTGVGIPLGVALIALGAGSIVTAIGTNSNGIKDKIKGTWSDIKTWWGKSVAPVFTTDWWSKRFSSITSGLKQPLKNAGNAIHGFATDICNNIGGALSMLGQSWSYSIPSFSIPALATGAVIPPNSEFLAVLGDQKRGRNIEAPEDLIRQIVRDETGKELASSLALAMMQVLPMAQGQGAGDVVMNVYLDGQVLARCVNENNAEMARRGLVKPVFSYE